MQTGVIYGRFQLLLHDFRNLPKGRICLTRLERNWYFTFTPPHFNVLNSLKNGKPRKAISPACHDSDPYDVPRQCTEIIFKFLNWLWHLAQVPTESNGTVEYSQTRISRRLEPFARGRANHSRKKSPTLSDVYVLHTFETPSRYAHTCTIEPLAMWRHYNYIPVTTLGP